MSPKSLSSLLVLSLLLLCHISSALPGGWAPIPDLNDSFVQDAAKFAVLEHNMHTKSELVYESILSGDQQIVEGWKFRLIIKARNGATEGKYQAVVWLQPWRKFKKLLSFTKLGV